MDEHLKELTFQATKETLPNNTFSTHHSLLTIHYSPLPTPSLEKLLVGETPKTALFATPYSLLTTHSLEKLLMGETPKTALFATHHSLTSTRYSWISRVLVTVKNSLNS